MRKKEIPRIYWLILTATGGCSIAFLIGWLLTDEDALFNLFLFCVGVFAAEFVTIIHNIKGDESDCFYKQYIESMGIIKIYPKRDKDYVEDLSYDLCHLGNKQQIVRMFGVSLKFYFIDDGIKARDETPLPWIIKDQSKKHRFEALVCDETNQELLRRNDITKNMKLTRETGQPIASEIDIVQDIKKVIDEVNQWRESDGEIHIDFQHYNFAPYATIIYINDKIYYTPNMPYEKRRIREGDRNNPHPTLCILRKSELGTKLEDLFDVAWKLSLG